MPKEMKLIEKIKLSTLHPTKFFNNIKSEKGIKKAFKYYAILSLISLVAMTIASLAGINTSFPFVNPSMNQNQSLGLFGPVSSYLTAVIGSFIGAAFIHLFVYLMKGRQGYSNTYKATVYSSTPSLLLGWIPVVGIVASLYCIYLLVRGVSILQKMTTKKAIIAAVIIPLIAAGIAAAIGITFAYYYAPNIIGL